LFDHLKIKTNMKTFNSVELQPLSRSDAEKIGPEDLRYADLVQRGFNKRFNSKPTYIQTVGSREQVLNAVQDAVQNNLRMVARSGGHCLEGFVSDPSVQVIIDCSLMTGVYFDHEMNAFAVEAGSLLGEMYHKLYMGWGVTIPAGVSADVGVGGHILGGAFGFLCREFGLAADYLYAVELVVVDDQATAKFVIATREEADPNYELWWAHTGGGGGNFGIATRYWFRTRGVAGNVPAEMLPAPPASVSPSA
jgi:FAD/FMN-containing dehydrogenase